MERRPEAELMTDPVQANAYANADFSKPHNLFVELFRDRFGPVIAGTVLDLGCGAADICVRFADAFPACRIDGIDASPAMLQQGQARIQTHGLQSRVRLLEGYLPGAITPERQYDVVLSNSLLHHLQDPRAIWLAAADHISAVGPVFVMDLLRPASEAKALELVRRYAGSEPAILQRDFFNSLLAAYRPEEIEYQLETADLPWLKVEIIDDHHLLVSGRPGPGGNPAASRPLVP